MEVGLVEPFLPSSSPCPSASEVHQYCQSSIALSQPPQNINPEAGCWKRIEDGLNQR